MNIFNVGEEIYLFIDGKVRGTTVLEKNETYYKVNLHYKIASSTINVAIYKIKHEYALTEIQAYKEKYASIADKLKKTQAKETLLKKEMAAVAQKLYKLKKRGSE